VFQFIVGAREKQTNMKKSSGKISWNEGFASILGLLRRRRKSKSKQASQSKQEPLTLILQREAWL
jgi:hypothetical protein